MLQAARTCYLHECIPLQVIHRLFLETGLFETFRIPHAEFMQYFHRLELGYKNKPCKSTYVEAIVVVKQVAAASTCKQNLLYCLYMFMCQQFSRNGVDTCAVYVMSVADHNRVHATDVLHGVYYLTSQRIPGFRNVTIDSDRKPVSSSESGKLSFAKLFVIRQKLIWHVIGR